jgi:hypothetical protein
LNHFTRCHSGQQGQFYWNWKDGQIEISCAEAGAFDSGDRSCQLAALVNPISIQHLVVFLSLEVDVHVAFPGKTDAAM